MSQSIMMSERLQKKNSEQTESTKSTLSQVASHARMCRAPVLEKALRTAMGKLLAADYGENTQGSLANLDHDGSWLKMSEDCCQQVLISDREETLELFSGTWPTWGTMRFGRVTELKPLARHTRGKECSSWPTVVASDGAQGAVIGKDDTFYTTSTGMPRKVNRNGTDGSVGLGRLVQMWRTPDANLGARGPKSAEMYEECKKTNKHAVNLLDQVKHEGNWPTPRSREGNAGEAGSKGAKHNAKKGYLDGVVLQNWPTPTACDHKGAGPTTIFTDSDGNTHDRTNMRLDYSVYATDNKGQLNADWVEILMGLPIGWTDIDCEEPQPWPGWPAPMNAGMRRTPMAGNPTKNGRNEPNLPEQAKITECGQYPYEPPRVTVGQKNRAKRLKCLGNGCCPAQVYPIFKAIMEIERVSR